MYQERERYWEDSFPEISGQLLEIIRFFEEWIPELEPLHLGVKELVGQGVFWREVYGIRVFSENQLDRLENELWTPLGDSLHAYYWGLMKLRPRYSPEEIWNSVDGKLGALLEKSLLPSIVYPCCLIAGKQKEEAENFRQLHQLWRSGNFPIGFDLHGSLLLLVAEDEPFPYYT